MILRILPLCLLFAACDMQSCEREPDAGPNGDGVVKTDLVHDPLSRPEEPTLRVERFNSSASCVECHEQYVKEWKTSMHAYAMVDPVYRALVHVRQEDFGGEQDQFCLQCHSAIGTRGGEIRDGFAFEELSEVVLEGVTCEACHKISSVERYNNAGHVLKQGSTIFGPIVNPETSDFHSSSYSELQESSQLCASCHDVVELNGLELERPFQEWLEAPGEKTCQECHMPASLGIAAINGPQREIHSHRFLGVDIPLTEGFISPEEETLVKIQIQELLTSAASLRVQAADPVKAGEQLDLVVTIKNEIDGHNLPTGSTFIRQLWLHLVVKDENDTIIYETGNLDANGDLRDHFSELDKYGDDDLVVFGSRLIGIDGNPEIFPWRAVEIASSTLSPLYERTHTLFVQVPADSTGTLHIEARLLFRSHGPFLLRALALDELVERVDIIEMAKDEIDVEIR